MANKGRSHQYDVTANDECHDNFLRFFETLILVLSGAIFMVVYDSMYDRLYLFKLNILGQAWIGLLSLATSPQNWRTNSHVLVRKVVLFENVFSSLDDIFSSWFSTVFLTLHPPPLLFSPDHFNHLSCESAFTYEQIFHTREIEKSQLGHVNNQN